MPDNITKPLALNAFNDFNTLDLYGPLESVISLMPKFDGNTRLEEVQNFTKAIYDSITRIKTTQEELNIIFRRHKFFWLRAHLRATFIYLDRVNSAFQRMNDAMAANSPDKISAEVSAILALKGESAQLDNETQELLLTYHISEDETKKSKVDVIKAAVEVATRFKMESPSKLSLNIPDELDLHGKTVEEAIPLIDKYLEDGYSVNKRTAWIVHGKGTGVLRQVVGEYLSKHRLVRSYALADSSRGGDGATQVEFID